MEGAEVGRNACPPHRDDGVIKVTDCIHPDTEADLFADDDIAAAFQRAAPRGPNNPLFTGEIGDYLGVRFVVTSNAKIYASLGLSGADVYGTLFIGKNAFQPKCHLVVTSGRQTL